MTIDLETMGEAELHSLRKNIQKAINRRIVRRRRDVLKEAKRLATDVGYEVTFNKKTRRKVPPKYSNPANSKETWSGRGHQPRWMRAALAAGQSLEDMAINTGS